MSKPNAGPDPLAPLVAALAELRIAYDRFIGGLERVEPMTLRQQFRAQLRQTMARPPTNTAQAFRLQTLRSQILTFETYWDRMVKQIEAGTLPRLQRAPAPLMPKGHTPPNPPETALPQPEPTASPTLQALHRDYIQAAQTVGISTALPLKDFVTMVDRHVATVQSRTGWKDVILRVALENGRPTLRAKQGS
jgi:hypothetical protein